LKRVFFT